MKKTFAHNPKTLVLRQIVLEWRTQHFKIPF